MRDLSQIPILAQYIFIGDVHIENFFQYITDVDEFITSDNVSLW